MRDKVTTPSPRNKDQIGLSPPPTVADYDLLGRDDAEFSIHGQLIGFGSSRQEDRHSHPEFIDGARAFAAQGERCSACRWFEIRIFVVESEYADDCTCSGGGSTANGQHEPHCGREPARARYLVLTYGRSEVPSETTKRRAEWTDSPFTVIELLTQRNSSGPFLPVTSARAIAEAAAWDDGIKDAYINRAVV